MTKLLKIMLMSAVLSSPLIASAEQVHIDQLGVGVSIASVIEQPSWALLKEEGPVSMYTGWIDRTAALVIIVKDDQDRIRKFSVKVPGGGDAAATAFGALRDIWGDSHEMTGEVKRLKLISCRETDKAFSKDTLSIGALYEMTLTPAGSDTQGVLLTTKERPILTPGLREYAEQIENGVLAGADPDWSGKYLQQLTAQKDALKAAMKCEIAKPLEHFKEFELGKAINEQEGFSQEGNAWHYSGFFVGFELPFADGEAFADAAGRLNDIRFERSNITVGDFNTMVEFAKVKLGVALEVEQSISTFATKTKYLWKTAGGSVELSQNVIDSDKEKGQLNLRYYLRSEEH